MLRRTPTGHPKNSWYVLPPILALDLRLAQQKLDALLQEIKSLPPPNQLRCLWSETSCIDETLNATASDAEHRRQSMLSM